MGKKMSLIPFLFKLIDPPSSSSWPWPAACGSPKTLSFRAEKIMNSVYVTESRFTNSSESESAGRIVSTAELVEENSGGAESIENVIRGLKSDRLFFEAGETSSRILGDHPHEQGKGSTIYDGLKHYPLEESSSNGNGNTTVMEMESRDPFVDFKISMEEMVEAHGLKDNWEGLQELLGWYLKVNGKSNHGYIVGAFVDLLVALHFTSSSSSCCDGDEAHDDGDIDSCSATAISQSPISALSFSSSSSTSNSTSPNCLSSLEEEAPAAHDHLHQEESLVQDDHKANSSTSDV